jgi:hypothetical protein
VTISAVPFVRVTALAAIAIVVAAVVLRVVAHGGATSAASPPPRGLVSVGGLVYQVPEARVLDPANPVDRAIVGGVSATRRRLPAGQEWFGVFLTVANPGRRVRPAARRFVLVSFDGRRFRPQSGVGADPYAYRPGDVAPGRVYPPGSSVAAQNLTARGALLLFRIARTSLDGPVVLRISDPAGHAPPADLPVG